MSTLNIAHRGGGALMPETSLAAFRNAIALAADGVELDVQLSADGVAVISALSLASDPNKAARNLLAAVDSARARRGRQ